LSDYINSLGAPVDGVGPPAAKSQREHRRKAFKAGIIAYQNRSLTVDCVVRDLSSTGAKLQYQENNMVPDHFTLTIPMEGQRVECEVRWRRSNLLGVVFVSDIEQDNKNSRKQSVDVEYVVSKKPSILRKS
jgi:hypothetical protein